MKELALNEPAGPLSEEEAKRLNHLEGIVLKNIGAFMETGFALAEIRNKRLYRGTHRSFEAYCKTTLGMGKVYAHRLICAYEVKQNLVPIGTILPSTESQARPLSKLDPEQQKAVWQHVLKFSENEGQKITAGLINRMVKKFLSREVVSAINKVKRQVSKEPVFSKEFRSIFEGFVDAIQREKMLGWKETSRDAALRFLDEIRESILKETS